MGTVGVTPTSDIGAVAEGMVLASEVDPLEISQGTGDNIIKAFREEEQIVFSMEALEWKISNIDKYIGAGHISGDEFDFGGDTQFIEASLRLVHEMPRVPLPATYGSSAETKKEIYVDIWRARSDGDIDLEFDNELFGFDVDFIAIPVMENWAGEALATGENLYEIRIETTLLHVESFPINLTMTSSITLTVGATLFLDDLTMVASIMLTVGATLFLDDLIMSSSVTLAVS